MASDEQPFLVQAIFSFKGKNNDELCFKKGDIITVTQPEDEGWWEGTLNEKTGWFPSNYVKEYKINSECLSPSKVPNEIISTQRAYRGVVLDNFHESEKAHVHSLLKFNGNYLQPLEKTEIFSKEEYQQVVSNMKEVISLHETLLLRLEKILEKRPNEQRVGKMMLVIAPMVKQSLLSYCTGHPKAVALINKHKDDLAKFAEVQGGNFITLASGLSQPFRRLEKYSMLLQEVERHLEENHPDRGDTQRAVSVFKEIAEACSVLRRQKELELEVISGGVREWEGPELSTLGEIIHMGSVAVGPEHRDRYLVLFHSTLLILSVSHRMSAFIYEGKLLLTGIRVKKLEDSELVKNAFEITGSLIEKIVAVCQTKEDQQKWVTLISAQCSLVGAKASPLPQFRKSKSVHEDIPPDIWSISRLRPSPPMRPPQVGSKLKENVEKNFEADAEILKVIASYCGKSSRYTLESEDFVNLPSGGVEQTKEVVDHSFKDVVNTINTLRWEIVSLQNRVTSLTEDLGGERSAREKLENQLHFFLSNNSLGKEPYDNKTSVTSL